MTRPSLTADGRACWLCCRRCAPHACAKRAFYRLEHLHAAAIVKRGKLLAWACNAVGTRSRGVGYSERTIHAERNCVRVLGNMALLRGADMYVFRVPPPDTLSETGHNFLYSKPCPECTVFLSKCMREWGLNRVYFTLSTHMPVAETETPDERARREAARRARMPRRMLKRLLAQERMAAAAAGGKAHSHTHAHTHAHTHTHAGAHTSHAARDEDAATTACDASSLASDDAAEPDEGTLAALRTAMARMRAGEDFGGVHAAHDDDDSEGPDASASEFGRSSCDDHTRSAASGSPCRDDVCGRVCERVTASASACPSTLSGSDADGCGSSCSRDSQTPSDTSSDAGSSSDADRSLRRQALRARVFDPMAAGALRRGTAAHGSGRSEYARARTPPSSYEAPPQRSIAVTAPQPPVAPTRRSRVAPKRR